MVIVTTNDVADFVYNESFLDDIGHFNSLVERFRVIADLYNSRNGFAALLNVSRNNATLRTIEEKDSGETTENTIFVSIVHDSPITQKKWVKIDRMVQNSQGGTTHFTGWGLE